MTNHPNRSRIGAPKGGTVRPNPDPADIRAAREKAGLTQTEAGALIYSTLRTWQDWEGGQRRMHPGLMELFEIKVKARKRPAAKPAAE
jgi:putative transcriptional regulator